MRLRHLGYACINQTLGTKSRTVRLANLRTEAVIPVVVQNLDDVLAALRWNVDHGIRFFRVSSDLIPFGPLPEFPFDWAEAFDWQFRDIRRLVKAEKLRVTSHPGQYTVLNSPREKVVRDSVGELDFQAQVLKRMDPKGTMTLHVGGAYGDKESAMDRFAQNLDRLTDDARERLAIENDDTTYTLAETVGLAERTGLPVIVDLFHHLLNPGTGTASANPSGETWNDGLPDLMERAMATWGRRVPKLHLSSHKPGTRTGHADFLDMDDVDRLLGLMDGVGGADDPYDLMLEAKTKERAVLEVARYIETGERPDRAIPMETVEEAEAA
ncbi:UV DNA damage repair endonuclease UvsE [Rubrivirga sp. S365]|uniref:UV DNA damage repair endonuclease UvsE n=1 Tax=Rubrivirga litoralis TaxID=3075598 RepID=A0ABU3BSK2_9BACT|nr:MULTISPECIES: UV DNA damage repair endonuclease UvsE [unclassified Rubrivirga]MDT0632275.1 UV DNA damage repair endonuclease UvsE [Rubrivirga sp. F394]MDT7856340.1 UV DNA damage repair endonuclease UvsE [Rubrivirga sp. S365]